MTTPIERAFLFLEDIEHNKQQWLDAGHTLRSGRDKQTLMVPIYTEHFSSEFNRLDAQDRPTHTLYQLFRSDALENIEYVRTQHGTQSKIAAIEPNQVTVVDLSLDLVFDEIYDSRPRRRIRKQYFSFLMAEHLGEWKIFHIQNFDQDPDESDVQLNQIDTYLNQTSLTAPWRPLPKNEGPSENIFRDGYTYQSATGHVRRINVHHLGEIHLPSGAIAVSELIDLAANISPESYILERRVHPGIYPVEQSTDSDAIRIVFEKDTPVHSWHPAYFLDGNQHYVYSNVATSGLYDAKSVMEASKRNIQNAKDYLTIYTNDDAYFFTQLSRPYDGVVVPSGLGDGAYPIYWGVGVDGQPVCLMIDFLIHAYDLLEHTCIPLSMIAHNTRYNLPTQGIEEDMIVRWTYGETNTICVEIESTSLDRCQFKFIGPQGEAYAKTGEHSQNQTTYQIQGIDNPNQIILLVECFMGWRCY